MQFCRGRRKLPEGDSACTLGDAVASVKVRVCFSGERYGGGESVCGLREVESDSSEALVRHGKMRCVQGAAFSCGGAYRGDAE
jgi:hypothetical protein